MANLLRCAHTLMGFAPVVNAPTVRDYFRPDISNNDVPAHRFLRSVHNIVIERGWLRLRLLWGENVYLEYMKGVDAGIYDESDEIH